MPVRRTSIGVVFFGSAFRSETIPGGSFRFAVELIALVCSTSSFLLGSPPCQRRKITSSKDECSTRSLTSYPR